MVSVHITGSHGETGRDPNILLYYNNCCDGFFNSSVVRLSHKAKILKIVFTSIREFGVLVEVLSPSLSAVVIKLLDFSLSSLIIFRI